MIHLIRNAVDHALETPDERLARGQAADGPDHACRPVTRGTASRSGSRTTAGGSTASRSSARGSRWAWSRRGPRPTTPGSVSLIFEPGFSTRDQVSELSGRGVGLDVVRDAVRAFRGSLAVESTPGKGTTFIFRLPLTLALIDGLLVETAGEPLRRPAGAGRGVRGAERRRSRPCRKGGPASRSGASWCRWSRSRKLFRADGAPPARQELLLTRHAGQRVGVAVDGSSAASRRSSSRWAKGLHGLNRFSGATILGDGSVSLILDLAALVSESRVADNGYVHAPGRREGGGFPMRMSLANANHHWRWSPSAWCRPAIVAVVRLPADRRLQETSKT